jgi:hypothetical protein
MQMAGSQLEAKLQQTLEEHAKQIAKLEAELKVPPWLKTLRVPKFKEGNEHRFQAPKGTPEQVTNAAEGDDKTPYELVKYIEEQYKLIDAKNAAGRTLEQNNIALVQERDELKDKLTKANGELEGVKKAAAEGVDKDVQKLQTELGQAMGLLAQIPELRTSLQAQQELNHKQAATIQRLEAENRSLRVSAPSSFVLGGNNSVELAALKAQLLAAEEAQQKAEAALRDAQKLKSPHIPLQPPSSGTSPEDKQRIQAMGQQVTEMAAKMTRYRDYKTQLKTAEAALHTAQRAATDNAALHKNEAHRLRLQIVDLEDQLADCQKQHAAASSGGSGPSPPSGSGGGHGHAKAPSPANRYEVHYVAPVVPSARTRRAAYQLAIKNKAAVEAVMKHLHSGII